MKIIELSKFSPSRRSYGGSEPFAMYFVYPKGEEPCLVKGTSDEVRDYVDKHFPIALFRYTFWQNGKSRGHWQFTGSGRYISYNGRKIVVHIHDSPKNVRELSFRRLPHRWIPEFDQKND